MPFFQHGIPKSLARGSLKFKRPPQPTRTLFSRAQAAPPSAVRATVYAATMALSATVFAVYYCDARSALHRYVVMPVARSLFDAETGHKLAVKLLKSGLGPRDPVSDTERLKCKLWDEELSNPIGLAAGFDKDGEAIDGLFNLGFSWVEIGSPGNPKPRMFRLEEDSAVINRYGFPSQGHTSVLARVKSRLPSFRQESSQRAALRDEAILAVNLGKNKESPAESPEDFVSGVRTFGPFADVLVVNVSSPNTPGLRGLQNRELLETLLSAVVKARDELPPSPITSRRPRLVLKIAPDLNESQIVDIADVIRKNKIDGVIVSNTTIQRPKHLISAHKEEVGGLSGPPIKPYSLKALKTMRENLPSTIPLIGAGGISSGKDALEFAKAGASMVQLYTSFGYDGVGTCRRIKDQLDEELVKEGKTWEQVVNEAVDKLSWKEPPPPKPEAAKADGGIGQLISEAKELEALLDKLGDSEKPEAAKADGGIGQLISEAKELEALLDKLGDSEKVEPSS
ncbi:hypothetical protein CVT24_001517 [Panaeolus cyanescens]|uniref:Dihydroorotate dehydrogenase (quinone), mitochondrial n=1 Tax=Panaeolus cyanescens TaxID=181874 RepID=A0A409YF89_9AGAR|nr:hypothetical protein CVT24_001517 [Panaeolus cyanescens]